MNTFSFTYNNDHYSIRSNGNNTMTVTVNDKTNTFKVVKENCDYVYTIKKCYVGCSSTRRLMRYFKRGIDKNIAVNAWCIKPLRAMLHVKPVSNLK